MIGRTNTGGGGVGGTLTVTAPAGVSVSVSKDGKTKSKTANSNGLAVFKGLATGTWTLTITNGSQTSSKPVVITADYSTVIAFFSATINITYPAGSTCTCTDGFTTLTAPNKTGSWQCIVPNAGTWTVHSTNGTNSSTKTVSIATDGQTENVVLSYILWIVKDGVAQVTFTNYQAGIGQGSGYLEIGGSDYGYHNTYTTVDVTGKEKMVIEGTGATQAGIAFYSAGGAGNDNVIAMTDFTESHSSASLNVPEGLIGNQIVGLKTVYKHKAQVVNWYLI